MPRANTGAALFTKFYCINRPALTFSLMSDNCTIDIKGYAEKRFNFIAGFARRPELMRCTHLAEKQTGVHEILERYL